MTSGVLRRALYLWLERRLHDILRILFCFFSSSACSGQSAMGATGDLGMHWWNERLPEIQKPDIGGLRSH
jgi:hypothetical protein